MHHEEHSESQSRVRFGQMPNTSRSSNRSQEARGRQTPRSKNTVSFRIRLLFCHVHMRTNRNQTRISAWYYHAQEAIASVGENPRPQLETTVSLRISASPNIKKNLKLNTEDGKCRATSTNSTLHTAGNDNTRQKTQTSRCNSIDRFILLRSIQIR